MMQTKGVPSAIALLSGGDGNRYLRGVVRFLQKPRGILVQAEVSGLPHCGFFGFHIHEGGTCTGSGFMDTLGHYDPTNMPHPMHLGDLPPLLSAGGYAYMAVLTDRFSIQDVLGRTIVIHSHPDDFNTQPSGNAGDKIACGVIDRVHRNRV